MNVTVGGTSVVLLLCDFLEKSGLTATLTALETETNVQSSTPGSAAVRSLALSGKWRELEKALLLRHEREGQQHELFKRAQYSLTKQLYLETVAALDAVSPHREPSDKELDELLRCLKRLERLAPSREEYSTLQALSETPTNFFGDWNLQKARKETCEDLLAWCREDYFTGRGDKAEKTEKKSPDGEIHQLILLLVKGKIYEQCEQIITRRCKNVESSEVTKPSVVLHIPSWLENQPDSVFQDTPTLVPVVETVGNPGDSPANTLPGDTAETQTPTAAAAAHSNEPSHLQTQSSSSTASYSQSPTATPPLTKIPAKLPPKPSTPFEQKQTQHHPSPLELPKLSFISPPPIPVATTALQPEKIMSEASDATTAKSTKVLMKEKKTEGKREEKRNRLEKKEWAVSVSAGREGKHQREAGEVKETSNAGEKSKRERVAEHRENVEVATDNLRGSFREDTHKEEKSGAHQPSTSPPKATSSPIALPNQQTLGFNDDFCDQAPPDWALQTTPLIQPKQKADRHSSTPKPSTQHFITSPPTSPVPHHTSSCSQATPSGWGHQSERKQIDFDREVSRSYRTEEEERPLMTASWPTAELIGRVTDTQAVRSVAFSESGQLVAVGANSKCLRILSTAPLLNNSGEELTSLQELPRYHRGSIYCLAWSGDRVLASGSNDKSIRLLICRCSSDSSGVVCESGGRMVLHQGTVRELAFLTDTLLASGGSGDPSLLLSDCETLKMVTHLSGHEKQVLSVARGGQRSAVVSGGEDGTVRLWDWSTGKCAHTLPLSETVTSLSAHEDTLAVAMVDGSCAVYDVRNWGLVTSYQPHSDECRSLRHSPCGRWLLTSSYDGSVCLGEAGGVEWVEVAQHDDKVVQTRWHPRGEIFASTSSDKTACFWSLQC